MIAIVDYGVGNLASISNMLKHVGADGVVSSDPAVIGRAEGLILPGVGAFDRGMEQLEQSGFIDLLNDRVLVQKIPVLGICLGMQMLGRGSDEGSREGLGWVDGYSKRFQVDSQYSLRVPHMGWNSLVRFDSSHWLLHGFEIQPRFYFAHSFHLECDGKDFVLGETLYGETFTSVVAHQNILGTQFHPEKSHRFGMQLMRNFATKVAASC